MYMYMYIFFFVLTGSPERWNAIAEETLREALQRAQNPK